VSRAVAVLSVGLLGAVVACFENNEYQEQDCYVATPADAGISAACAPPTAAATILYAGAGPEPCGTIQSVDEGPADGGLDESGPNCCYLVTWNEGVCLGL
jgi:hypothetical protein